MFRFFRKTERIKKMSKVILFQGDSITDAGRERDFDVIKGYGYPTFVTGKLGERYPGEYTFYNRGISGNRIVDVYARIKADIINLKPDYMSILIGVNDVWHEFGGKNGVDTEKFERIYCMLIEEVKAALPDIKFMILEPFVLHGAATDGKEDYPDKYADFRADVEAKAAAAKRVAEKYGITFVPLQKAFDEAAEKAPPSYWAWDGVHPTPMGHRIIERAWIAAFEENK